MSFQTARRRMIASAGRPMTLQRPNDAVPPADLPVTGFLALYQPEQIKPPLVQGDARVQLTNDEISAASWPHPGAGAYLVVDGVTWAVLAANPVYDGPDCIGWSLWVRGGQP